MNQTATTAPPDLDFPFASQISLQPLLDAWRSEQAQHPLLAKFADEIEQLANQQPELFQPHPDTEFLRSQQELIKLILLPALSFADSPNNLAAVIRPYYYDFAYVTPAFRDKLIDEHNEIKALSKVGDDRMSFGRQLSVYANIAKQVYDLNINFDPHITHYVTDPETGLRRFYQFHYNAQYLTVVPRKKPKPLSQEQRQQLTSNVTDLAMWQRLLPPADFELQGVVIIEAVDITEREVISSLHQAMTEGLQLVSQQGLFLLNQSTRDLLRNPDVSVRLLASQGGKVFMISNGCQGHEGCLISNSQHFACSELAGSIYQQTIESKTSLLVKDTSKLAAEQPHPMHDLLLQKGVQSAWLIPLQENCKTFGILELDYPTNDHHADLTLKVADIISIATQGLKQSRQMLEQGIRSVIQQKCSVIHPSVDWRFRQAALDMITGNRPTAMEEIVFPEVFPLFSQSDIKDSSMYRNRAIQTDLIAQLKIGQQVLYSATAQRPMPIIDEMDFRIQRFLHELEQGLKSGDELSINQFFKQELEPMFEQLCRLGDNVEQAIADYRSQLDPRYGAIHAKRSEYERSVQRINDSIAQFLDGEEQDAQAMFPHYFETTCTDGVEIMLYVGAKLVEDGQFDLFYLYNLRLWQLRITCQIARLCERLEAKLPLPLKTTHLILVQDAPLSIRFSETEKQFIVDGAYNIRYEIMKKRIDKAMVKNGSERLTQPGKIAIVYSHTKEAQEYRRYIDYLQHQQYLMPEIEDLELESMQGLQGLRALRVTVNLDQIEQAAEQSLTDQLLINTDDNSLAVGIT